MWILMKTAISYLLMFHENCGIKAPASHSRKKIQFSVLRTLLKCCFFSAVGKKRRQGTKKITLVMAPQQQY